MTQKQLIAIAVGLFILILALLIWRRFDMPEQLDVSVTAVNGGSSYEVNDSIRRGATIDSEDDFLQFKIGEDTYVSLANDSVIEFEDLGVVGAVVRLHKGRILVSSTNTPIWITTDTTENAVVGGSASFVNYDFLETVHIIPIESSVQTSIKSTGDYLLLPVPIAVKEGNESGYEVVEVNLEAGDSAAFYDWAQNL